MKLTVDLRNKLLQKFQEKWRETGSGCEACGAENFSMPLDVFELSTLQNLETLATEKRQTIPLFVITCNNCGTVRLVNGITIGLIDPKTGGWVDG